MSAVLSPDPKAVWTVTRLTAEIKRALQTQIGQLWVEGEISNYTRSGAGHAYLTLKDDKSQVKAVIWNREFGRIPFQPSDGLQVLAFGSLDVYGARGQYQLNVQQLVPRGIGPLELAFRQLRDKLSTEGLFDPARKRPIPPFPQKIAIITSPRAAALRDFLEVAGRRCQGIDIILVPAAVQGDRAAPELRAAVELANRLDVELIALIRGGGSLEDLWAFNDEELARAIYASRLPIVAGIGHEIDVTIADLTADLRALTPSEAAERIFPDQRALRASLQTTGERLAAAMIGTIQRATLRVDRAEQSRPFRSPLETLREPTRRADDLEAALTQAVRRLLERMNQSVTLHGNALDALSPLKVLSRGYSLVSTADGKLVRSAQDVKQGDGVRVRLMDGRLECRVEEVAKDND